MKSKILILLMLIGLCPIASFSENRIVEADSAYSGKEYERAVSLYTAEMLENGTSAALLFNIGNAYFQMGDYGNAMLNWLRARRLDPSNKEINTNINYLQSRVEDSNKAEQKGKRLKVTPDEPSFFQSVYASIAEDVSSNLWAVLGAAAFILFMVCVALYIFTRNVALRKTGFFGGMICFMVSLLFVVFAFMGAKTANARDQGVVTAYKVSLLTEPGKTTDAAKGGVLTKGTKVQILSEEVDAEGNVTWFKVRLNTDYIGWIAASDMEIV